MHPSNPSAPQPICSRSRSRSRSTSRSSSRSRSRSTSRSSSRSSSRSTSRSSSTSRLRSKSRSRSRAGKKTTVTRQSSCYTEETSRQSSSEIIASNSPTKTAPRHRGTDKSSVVSTAAGIINHYEKRTSTSTRTTTEIHIVRLSSSTCNSSGQLMEASIIVNSQQQMSTQALGLDVQRLEIGSSEAADAKHHKNRSKARRKGRKKSSSRKLNKKE